MSDFTQAELEKAVTAYLKRLEYNKRWQEKNADKVAAYRHKYNVAKWQKEKAALKQAREAGLL